jgi:hypothetical protein
MPDSRKTVEINEPTRNSGSRALREYLISASNELFLFENACLQEGRPVPTSLTRAHAAIRAELKRLSTE